MHRFLILTSIQHKKMAEESLKAVFGEEGIHSWQENAFSVRVEGSGTASVEIFHREEAEDFEQKHLHLLHEVYSGLDYDDPETAKLIRVQLAIINAVIVIQTATAVKPYNEDPWYRMLVSLTRQLNGVAMLEDHSLLDGMGRVIVHPDGKKGDADFRPFAAEKMVLGIPPTSEEGRLRKAASISRLTALGIGTNGHLPELPPSDALIMRTRMEVAQRAATALIVIQFACDIAYEQLPVEKARQAARENLRKYGLKSRMTEREKDFLSAAEPGKAEAALIIWHYEACWVLMWALNLVEALPFPDRICDTRVAIATLFSCSNFIDFYKETRLREAREILDEADLNYHFQWASTQSRLDGQEPAAGMNPGVIMERERGFDWLLRLDENDWDVIAATDVGPENELLINGRIHLEGVSNCTFQSHEDLLEDDSYCFYGYETVPGAQIDMWGKTASFRAQVSPKGTPVVLKEGELEDSDTLTRLKKAEHALAECQRVLESLQEEAMPRVDPSLDLELQKHYDARGLFEQVQALAAVFANKELDFAQQCEQFAPIFAQMSRLLKEPAASMPREYRQLNNAYGMTLFQLYIRITGIRDKADKDGLSLSADFTRAADELQSVLEAALPEEEAHAFSDEERSQINELTSVLNDPALSFDRRAAAGRRLWDDQRIAVDDRIDFVEAVIDLATELIEEAEAQTEQLMDDLAVIENRTWEDPEPAVLAINRQIMLLKEMEGALTGPFINLLTESPIRTGNEKSATQRAMDFFLDVVEVAVRESEVTGAYNGTMTLLFRNTPQGEMGQAIRVWLDDGLITGILPSWK